MRRPYCRPERSFLASFDDGLKRTLFRPRLTLTLALPSLLVPRSTSTVSVRAAEAPIWTARPGDFSALSVIPELFALPRTLNVGVNSVGWLFCCCGGAGATEADPRATAGVAVGCDNVTRTGNDPVVAYTCEPDTEKLPSFPVMTPVEIREPSPQSIVDVKSPGCESGFWSLNSATSPTNAVPAVALTVLPSPAMATSATVISPESVAVWASGPPLIEIVVVNVPKWAYLWSALTVYSHRAKSPPNRAAIETGSGAVPSPQSIVPVYVLAEQLKEPGAPAASSLNVARIVRESGAASCVENDLAVTTMAACAPAGATNRAPPATARAARRPRCVRGVMPPP